MRVAVKSYAVIIMSIAHSKLLCPFVHSLHEHFFRSRYIFAYRHTSIVCGGNNDRAYHIVCRHFLPDIKPYHRAVHSVRSCGSRYHCFHIECTLFHFLCPYQQAHQLGYRCHRQPFVRVMLVQHLPCRYFGNDCRLRYAVRPAHITFRKCGQ